MGHIEQVAAQGWKEWVGRTNGVIIDVREPWEWQSTGVLPESVTISLGELTRVTETYPTETPILLVCRSGNRSQSAAEYLARAGYSNVANLSGGIVALAA
jgi:phage shock protein E